MSWWWWWWWWWWWCWWRWWWWSRWRERCQWRWRNWWRWRWWRWCWWWWWCWGSGVGEGGALSREKSCDVLEQPPEYLLKRRLQLADASFREFLRAKVLYHCRISTRQGFNWGFIALLNSDCQGVRSRLISMSHPYKKQASNFQPAEIR